jgi:ATP-dependent DNA helicase DinG
MKEKNKALQSADSRFSTSAIDELSDAIVSAGGHEVFAVGKLSEEGKISNIEVVARGAIDKVPALESYFDKASVIVHNHPSGNLLPSEPDVEIAARAASAGVGSYIVDNEVTEVFIVAEPARLKALRMLDEEEISGILDEGGKLSGKMSNFEPRKSQVSMTRDVANTLNTGGILVAEAGTGVGKSFAYLVPSIAWALGNDEKVILSTATINLQKQLFDSDLPLVSSIFKKKVKTVLIKGRGNYLCKRRLFEAIEEEGLLVDNESPLRRILDWDASGGSGDRADLSFWPDDTAWNKVCSEGDNCMASRCPYHEKCHIVLVRKDAADASIIVANHHILFADLEARRKSSGFEPTSILPTYDALVLDEAHAIEASATSLFSEEFSKFTVFKKLARIRRKNKSREFGLAKKLAAIASLTKAKQKALDDALSVASDRMVELDRAAISLLAKERNMRLTERGAEIEKALCEPAGLLERSLLEIAKLLSDILETMDESLALDPTVAEAKMSIRSLTELSDLIARFKDFNAETSTVFWIAREKTSQQEVFVDFVATPLEVAPLLAKSIFGKVRTTICTSATLSVAETFDFWMRRVGIEKSREDVVAKTYASPFPFSSNAFLSIDSEAPLPKSPDYSRYIDAAVLKLLIASRGRALVLFTSYEALQRAYESSKPTLEAMGITCLRQGMDDRFRLLQTFKNDISSVLFATDSFWEGIDAPGETLSLVIMTKLPFRVPTDPIQMARAEAVEKRGGNPFMEISVPEAVIKFKQGFGRLIRHSEDRGAVAVLDQRLVSARYGQIFTASLPRCRQFIGSTEKMAREIERFLDE